MSAARHQRVSELFLHAQELDPRQRAAFLEQQCADDPALRQEVVSLLDGAAPPEGFLHEPALGPEFAIPGSSSSVESLPPASTVGLPERIGHYTIHGLLGEGGMGIVYKARQDNPERAVALKVIRPGVTSRRMLQRFEHEPQILARLQHPGIAQIYEAGTFKSDAGEQPFFAMELVSGEPLREYADARRLGTRQRLELLSKVCDAVQHAHQKGVIHRDLKPGNILVSESGQPKVLDFGVARLTDGDVQITTLQTDVGQLIGTIPYMSPEQVAGDPNDLDTRSDVYTLGVLCYELLSGRLPYELTGKPIPEAVRTIAEQVPVSLSVLDRFFRGDIETIVTKALEKEKDRRYQSASDLAADIRRYLSDQPISARPVTTLYQLRKFARRNRALVAGVAIAFAALSGGLVWTGWAERRARADKADAESVAAFYDEDIFRAAGFVSDWGGSPLTMRRTLDHASEALQGRFRGKPLIEAKIRATLGLAYAGLGAFEPAEEHLERSLALRRTGLGEEHAVTLVSMNDLASVYQKQGRFEEAEALHVATLDGRRRVLRADHPDTLISMSNLGIVYFRQARYDEAEHLFLGALAAMRRGNRRADRDMLGSMNNLANLYARQGRLDEAEPLMVETLDLKRRLLGGEHRKTLVTMNNLAGVLVELGRPERAEPLYLNVLEVRRRVLGDEHPRTLNSQNSLGYLYRALGRHDEAEALYLRTLAALRRVRGEEHPRTLMCMNSLAYLYDKQGRLEEAERLHAQTLAIRRRKLGDDHPDTLSSMNNLGVVLQKQGRHEEAETLLSGALAARRRVLGAEHPYTFLSLHNLADLRKSQKRLDEAEALYREAFENRQRKLGENHGDTLGSLQELARALIALKRFAEAEPLARENLERCRKARSRARNDTADAVQLLVELYQAWGKPERAAEYRALRIEDDTPDSPTVANEPKTPR